MSASAAFLKETMVIYKRQLPGGFWLAGAILIVFPAFGVNAVSLDAQQSKVQQQPAWSGAGASPTIVSAVVNAVEAAYQGGDLETLRRILKTGSPSGQASAFDSLHALDPQLAVESVVADFRDHELGSRLQSLQLIDRSSTIDSQTVTSILREALLDEDTTVSDYAIGALARRTRTDSVVLVPSDLSGPDGGSQQLARVRLAAINHDLTALKEMMRKEDSVVQSAAFEALAVDDAASAAAELVSVFHDKSSLNRLQTLELLVRTRYTDHQVLMQVLQQASADEDPLVKDYGKRVLDQENLERAQAPSGPNITH